MTSKIERYVRATQSTNLKDSPHDHNTEPLISMAFSKVNIACYLYRVKYCNDATSYTPLYENLLTILERKALARHWPVHVRPKLVADVALKYWINPLCYICKGRGEDVKINMRGGIDRSCQVCDSTGKRPVQAENRIKEYVLDTVALLEEAEFEAIRTMRR